MIARLFPRLPARCKHVQYKYIYINNITRYIQIVDQDFGYGSQNKLERPLILILLMWHTTLHLIYIGDSCYISIQI